MYIKNFLPFAQNSAMGKTSEPKPKNPFEKAGAATSFLNGQYQLSSQALGEEGGGIETSFNALI